MGIYVGFDPGGIGGFGWAVLSGDVAPLCLIGRGIADHAQGAFQAAVGCVGAARIDAVGIDAPLFWVKAGERRADQIVRKAIRQKGNKTAGGTVNSVNALRGACLIQGVIAAMMCHEAFGAEARITESHPKALLWLLGEATPDRLPANVALSDLNKYVCGAPVRGASEHERDAALGAIAAHAMESRQVGWQDLFALEAAPITPLHQTPGYWMPILFEKSLGDSPDCAKFVP